MKSEPRNRRPFFSRRIDSSDGIALSLAFISFFAGLYILIKKYVYFGYYDWDLALYANAMWNLSRGSFYSSIFGTNFLTNHAEYFSFILAPVYRLFGHPFLLIVLKLFSLIGGSFVLYLIAKEKLGRPIAVFLMLLYSIYPPNLFMLIYEFHFENLALVFIFLLYYFFQKHKLIPFLITAFFASLIKENIALIVVAFGLYAVFTKRVHKTAWTTGPLILGGGIFVVSMFVITPYLRMQEGMSVLNQYIGLYWTAPGKDISLFQGILSNLHNAWSRMSSPANIAFIKELFGPVNFLPFLSPHTLFLGAPVILQNFFSPVPQQHVIYFHYAATITAFVFLALITSLVRLKTRLYGWAFYAVIILVVLTGILNAAGYMAEFKGRLAAWPDRLDPFRWQMVEAVPPQASVTATFEFLDKLSSRRDLYSFHNMWRNGNPFTGKTPYRLPESVSMALIDWECPWFWGDVSSQARAGLKDVLRRASDFYFQGGWAVKEAVEELTLLEKGTAGNLPALVEVFQDLPPNLTETPVLSVDNKFFLLDFTVGKKEGLSPAAKIPLTFLWKAQEDGDDLYGMVIELKNGEETVFRWHHHLGYGIYATPLWKKGDYIKERYWLVLPAALSQAQYTFDILLVNRTRR